MVSNKVRRALVSSLTSKAIVAVLGLLAIPLYVHYLGLDAYGLVGFFASVQAVVSFLDFGLPATLTRALASRQAGADEAATTHDLVRTFELAYLAMTALACGIVLLAAPWLAAHWLQSSRLDTASLTTVLMMASLALASLWPSLLYGAALEGLEQQQSLARLTATLAFTRTVITLAALHVEPTVVTFFGVQIAMGLVQTLLTRRQMILSLPPAATPPRWRWSVIQDTRKFAGTMTAVSITAIALTQLDKLILSAHLPLQEFGVYVLAATLASGLYVLISPTFSVVYPALSRLWASNRNALPEQYQLASEVMAAMVMPLATVLAVFSPTVLRVWTGNDAIAESGALTLSLLVLGCALNGVMHTPYALQLAAGWARLPLYIHSLAIVFAAPSTWWAASNYGGLGGAAVWLGLNLGLLLFTPLFMHRRLLPEVMLRWYVSAVLVPMLVCAALVGLVSVAYSVSVTPWISVLQLVVVWLLALLATCAALPSLRQQLWLLLDAKLKARKVMNPQSHRADSK